MCRRRHGSCSPEVIRHAIGVLAKSVEAQEQAQHPYDKIRDLIGCVHGGPTNLSRATGETFRRMLSDRRRKA